MVKGEARVGLTTLNMAIKLHKHIFKYLFIIVHRSFEPRRQGGTEGHRERRMSNIEGKREGHEDAKVRSSTKREKNIEYRTRNFEFRRFRWELHYSWGACLRREKNNIQ